MAQNKNQWKLSDYLGILCFGVGVYLGYDDAHEYYIDNYTKRYLIMAAPPIIQGSIGFINGILNQEDSDLEWIIGSIESSIKRTACGTAIGIVRGVTETMLGYGSIQTFLYMSNLFS